MLPVWGLSPKIGDSWHVCVGSDSMFVLSVVKETQTLSNSNTVVLLASYHPVHTRTIITKFEAMYDGEIPFKARS